MEEKERYMFLQDFQEECAYDDYDYIIDTEINKIFESDYDTKEVLNQQDKRIKEQERENQQLKYQLKEKDKEIKKLSLYSEKLYKLEARIGLEERTVGDVVEELDRLRNQLELSQIENMQLKQLQKQLAELKQKAIVSKFKVGQEIYYIYGNEIRLMFVSSIEITNNLIGYHSLRGFAQLECNCFATREEAEQKLAEIKIDNEIKKLKGEK